MHATSQYVNFLSSYDIKCELIKQHINKHSEFIKIISVKIKDSSFNSRKSAIKRQYIYIFSNEELPVYLSRYVTNINFEINQTVVQDCLTSIIGQHDFAVFQKTGSAVSTTIREIYSAKIEDFQYKVLTDSHKSIILNKITIEGNAFLYRMIRNIIGSIFTLSSSKNKISIIDFKKLLIQNKRIFNFKPAPSAGLYLNKIWY